MRDLQNLCDRLGEIFNTDDTPDELSAEACEAIEELWKERDRLRDALQTISSNAEAGFGQNVTADRLSEIAAAALASH